MMNVYVYPTQLDKGKSLGLCGTLDNKKKLKFRDSTEILDPNTAPPAKYGTFSMSWK